MGRLRPVLACLLLAGCAAPPPPAAQAAGPPQAGPESPTRAGQASLELLASFFTGRWESAPADPPRVLRVSEFWKGGLERWFYLEWTRPGEAQPLRQHVLRVAEQREPGRLAVTAHRLPGDALRFAGEWRKERPFEGLGPRDMPAIEACLLQGLRSMDALFEMATVGARCPGDLPGVPHVRYELTLTSADLGFVEKPIDAAGNVPKGSRLEPYVYRRMAREPR
jgi:hypothetical protein